MLTRSPSLSTVFSVECCHLACGVAFGIRVLEQSQDQDITGKATINTESEPLQMLFAGCHGLSGGPSRSLKPRNHSQPHRTSQGEAPGCAEVPGFRPSFDGPKRSWECDRELQSHQSLTHLQHSVPARPSRRKRATGPSGICVGLLKGKLRAGLRECGTQPPMATVSSREPPQSRVLTPRMECLRTTRAKCCP